MEVTKLKQPKSDSIKEEVLDEDVTKFRLLGAMVWLTLLILIVPYWYSNPVNFSPDDQASDEAKNTQVNQSPSQNLSPAEPYLLPVIPQPDVVLSSETKVNKQMQSGEGNEVVTADKGKVKSDVSVSTQAESKLAPLKDQWIVRLVAYKKKQDADLLLDNIRYQYPAYIKQYPKSKLYSVRAGPYVDKNIALADQKELKQLLKVETELVKIPPSMQNK